MSIKWKLILSSLLTIGGIVSVACVGLFSLQRTQSNINQLTSHSTPLQVRTLEFQQVTEQFLADLLRMSVATRADDMERYAAAIDAHLASMEKTRAAVAALNSGSRLDIRPFREAATAARGVVAQRLKDLSAFNADAEAINVALKSVEEAVRSTSNELAGLSAQAVKGVSDAQVSGSRVNSTVKKLLTIQARLKDIELLVAAVDAAQNRFRLTPIRERFKGATDAIASIKQEADDPPLVKEIREAAASIFTQVTREGNGLLSMRAEVLAKKEVDSEYANLRKTILGTLEGLSAKVAEVVDPLELALTREKQKADRAIEFQTRAAAVLATNSGINADSKEVTAGIRLLMLASTDKELKEVRGGIETVVTRMRSGVDRMSGQLGGLGQARLASAAAQTVEAVRSSGAATEKLFEAKSRVVASDARLQALMASIRSLVQEQSKQGEARVAATAKSQQETVEEVNRSVSEAITAMLAISGALALLTIGIGVAITLSVTRPLRLMSSNVQAMEATGDLSQRIALKGRDEVGRTVEAFNTLMSSMHTSIAEINRVMGAVAEHDLTQRISSDAEGDFNTLKESINSSMRMLSETLRLIGENTQQVANAADETSQAIAQIAEGSETQQGAVASLSQAVEQSSVAMVEMAKGAELTCVSARESAAAVRAGRAKMSEMVGIAGKISANSERVSRISGLIGGIASQTNLLSLNAAIEAARAGEAGRGFAVVADEIGKLAKTVATSVEEISSLVGAAMNDSALAVAIAADVNQEMEKIESAASQAEALLDRITQNVREQSAAMGEISSNVRTLDTIAGQNATSAREISSTSAGLSELAARTREQVERFRVDTALH